MSRLLATVGVLLALSVFTVACDTTQPIGAGPITYEVQFSAVNVIGFVGGEGIKSYRVWEMFEDNNGDNMPDDIDGDGNPDMWNWCLDISQFSSSINPETVPWSFTLQVSVIRAGNTEEEVITSAAALSEDPAINLTAYDTSEQTVIFGAAQPPITIDDGGTMRTFRFVNPLKLSGAHERVARSDSNPLNDFDPMTYGFENGLCSETDPGPAVTDGQSPLMLDLLPGDTVIVRARRGALPPPGVLVNGREPQLGGALTQNGSPVVVIGDVTSDPVAGSGISFSFTAK